MKILIGCLIIMLSINVFFLKDVFAKPEKNTAKDQQVAESTPAPSSQPTTQTTLDPNPTADPQPTAGPHTSPTPNPSPTQTPVSTPQPSATLTPIVTTTTPQNPPSQGSTNPNPPSEPENSQNTTPSTPTPPQTTPVTITVTPAPTPMQINFEVPLVQTAPVTNDTPVPPAPQPAPTTKPEPAADPVVNTVVTPTYHKLVVPALSFITHTNSSDFYKSDALPVHTTVSLLGIALSALGTGVSLLRKELLPFFFKGRSFSPFTENQIA